MTNKDIAEHFSLLSKLMDIHGENSFRAKSYSIAAYHIENLPKQITDMEGTELFSMKGIGESVGKKIQEITENGEMQALKEMIDKTPQGILEMMQVKGLGPKKIALLWKEMGIDNIGELEYACNENRLVTIKGFGQKTQQSILENLAFIQNAKGFHLWAEVIGVIEALINNLRKIYPDNLFEITGDIRRQKDTVAFVEMITDLKKDTLFQNMQANPNAVIEDINENTSIVKLPGQPLIKVHFSTPKDFYKAVFLTTGSEAYIQAFQSTYKIPDNIPNEETIFTSNGLTYLPPALREYNPEDKEIITSKPETLIQPTDIKGIIHSHSTWSDGAATLEQMALAAQQSGYEYLVISDHSQAAYYAKGLKPEQIIEQHKEINQLNKKLAPFKIFKSIESDILNDGSLDYDEEVLNSFDLIIASVHSNLSMTEEKAMQRILTAVKNPYTSILGHPTGRLLLSRAGYPVNHKALIDACKEHQVVIEINAHPRRLDLDWQWINYAMSQNVLLSIDPDAHSLKGIKDVYFGVMSAQKGGLTKEYNLSSYSLEDFEKFIAGQQLKRIKK